jgi:hypothetical protein
MPATKTVNYGLGKRSTNESSLLCNSTHIIKDSFDFVRKFQQPTETDMMMVSFDVTSLYINVLLTFTIAYIFHRMYPTCSGSRKRQLRAEPCGECTKRKEFKMLLRTATSETYFLFNNKMHVQHDGVAMCAPLAPVLADIFMAHM